MRFIGRFLRSRTFLVCSGFALVVLIVVFVIWPKKSRINKANFGKIQVGMSQADLHQLLGPPQYEKVEIGRVEGPETYVISGMSNEAAFRRGFRYCQRQQWSSSEINITVILDHDGQVVCRYSSQGSPLDLLWLLRHLIHL